VKTCALHTHLLADHSIASKVVETSLNNKLLYSSELKSSYILSHFSSLRKEISRVHMNSQLDISHMWPLSVIITAKYDLMEDVQVINDNSTPDGGIYETPDIRSSTASLNSCKRQRYFRNGSYVT